MRIFSSSLLVFLIFTAVARAQPKTDSLLKNLLSTPLLNEVIGHTDKYRVQIIYTRIERNSHNKPTFTNFYYNYDPSVYFNPASTVKMPLAFLSLEKLHNHRKYSVTKSSIIQYDSTFTGQVAAYKDSTAATGFPSIEHYIKKAFLISDNDAYNRLYQYLGQQAINRKLHGKGYKSTRITRQFMGYTQEQNRHTNAIRFLAPDGALVYHQPPAYNPDTFSFPPPIKIGKAYYNRNDSLVNEPIDFTAANNVPLEDLQQMLQSVLFPKSVHHKKRFRLGRDDYKFLYRYLSQFPSETSFPKYDTAKFYDSYVKFFFRDSSHRLPPGVRVFNKVGWAYGFLTDVSYVADFEHRVEFMLSATLYVNSDEILNDNVYDYDSIGYPFLYHLGQTIYQYELNRPRKHRPNLSRLRIHYDRRDPDDMRPPVRDADN